MLNKIMQKKRSMITLGNDRDFSVLSGKYVFNARFNVVMNWDIQTKQPLEVKPAITRVLRRCLRGGFRSPEVVASPITRPIIDINHQWS